MVGNLPTSPRHHHSPRYPQSMRHIIALLLLATPAAAWEFTPTPLCTLTHDTPDVALKITYDPGPPLYTLTLTLRNGEWADSPSFGIAYTGPNALTIGTDRHSIDGATLTVQDSGVSNVLDGIEFNQIATAFTPSLALNIPLDGAAGPVQQFRACTKAAPPSV